jgi:hypothetical protein
VGRKVDDRVGLDEGRQHSRESAGQAPLALATRRTRRRNCALCLIASDAKGAPGEER